MTVTATAPVHPGPLQVVFEMSQESLHGGFRVEARLLGKRSAEPLEVGWGRARNKQIGKQVGRGGTS
jgi:hypothetical protein